MSIIALVSINHNLLPQVEVYHCRDDLAAAMVLPNSLGEVVAVQVVVIVQLVQHIVAVFQAANAHLDALDDLRAGEGSLPGKADDLLLTDAAGIPYRQNEYVVLLPIGDSDGQVVILQLKEIDDETEEYVGVENEFVLETVFALFKERNKDFFTFE